MTDVNVTTTAITTESIAASHDLFEHPVAGRRRNTSVELEPDKVAKVTIRMQPKGTEVINE